MNERVRAGAPFVRAIFAAIAPRYDFLNHLLSVGLDHRWRTRAAAACGPDGTVLDICCGTGDLSRAILARRGRRVVACDFSPAMLAQARRKLARPGRAAILQADALRLPLADGSVDAAASAFGLRNLADPAAGLAEMVRVVRPGGRVVVLEFHAPLGRGFRQRAFLLYFRRVLPRLARSIAGPDRGAYRHLVASVEAFGPAEATAEAMRAAGLEAVTVERLPGGVADIVAGRRPH